MLAREIVDDGELEMEEYAESMIDGLSCAGAVDGDRDVAWDEFERERELGFRLPDGMQIVDPREWS